MRIRSRAWRNCASAIFRFWFETSTRSSSAFNCGSLKISHHFPRSAWSCGWEAFHSAGRAGRGTQVPCKRVASGTVGLAYFGPGVQALDDRAQAEGRKQAGRVQVSGLRDPVNRSGLSPLCPNQCRLLNRASHLESHRCIAESRRALAASNSCLNPLHLSHPDCGAAMRTSCPSTSESGGLVITFSFPSRPDTTSTSVPKSLPRVMGIKTAWPLRTTPTRKPSERKIRLVTGMTTVEVAEGSFKWTSA